MSKVNVFFATGYEEIEALTVIDILRRAGIETNMVSVTGEMEVTGSHGITVKMDTLFDEKDEADMLVLPGGMPGTLNLLAHEGLTAKVKEYCSNGKYIAAICAAPTVFGKLGLLKERRATCYPGMEDELFCEEALEDAVVIDGKIITSRGMGTAIDFALALLTVLKDEEVAEDMSSKIVYRV
ncbi:MAG: DJ-1/PfpI family protein [Lachnospiraceae bacterium]|nr:DJ-1/PfpI family protein [Lachnospiraceae bacterium]